jgi:hypothetical protein
MIQWFDGPPIGLPCQGHAAEFDAYEQNPQTRRLEEGTATAHALCASCGEQEACLEWLLLRPDQHGYGAGMTSKQRVALRRRLMHQRREAS